MTAAEIEASVNADGSIASTYYTDARSSGISVNAALANTQDHMDSVAAAMNSKGSDVSGYITISGKTTSDIKSIKNQAQGSQQSIDTNAENRKLADVTKYTNPKK